MDIVMWRLVTAFERKVRDILDDEARRVHDLMHGPRPSSDEDLGIILRAHLTLERELKLTLLGRDPRLSVKRLEKVPFDNLRRRALLPGHPATPGVKALNRVRNKLAHNLKAAVLPEDVDPMRIFEPLESPMSPANICMMFAYCCSATLAVERILEKTFQDFDHLPTEIVESAAKLLRQRGWLLDVNAEGRTRVRPEYQREAR